MDPGGAVLHRPQLRRDGRAVLAGDAEPQRSRRPFLLGERAQEGEGAFLRLPARSVDLFVRLPGGGIEVVMDFDGEAGSAGLAGKGAAKL